MNPYIKHEHLKVLADMSSIESAVYISNSILSTKYNGSDRYKYGEISMYVTDEAMEDIHCGEAFAVILVVNKALFEEANK